MARKGRRSLDVELTERGLASSDESAREMILSGRVLVAGSISANPNRQVSPAEPVVVTDTSETESFASRGGIKIQAALGRFGIAINGTRCLDAGASTGGFTDCLLRKGAATVTAVDVGHGLIHEKLRNDPRVHLLERTNIRKLDLAACGGIPFDVIVADLSFISLRLVAKSLAVDLAHPGTDLVLLVKPQFEVSKAAASRSTGVISDPDLWTECLVTVGNSLLSHGACIMGTMPSPIRGAKGNVEFFLHAVAQREMSASEPRDRSHLLESIEAAVREVSELPG